MFEFRRLVGAIRGPNLPFYGLPDWSGQGTLPSDYGEQLLQIVRDNPRLHIASFYGHSSGRLTRNYYCPDAMFYHLCEGDSDPDLCGDMGMDPELLTPESLLKIQNFWNMVSQALEHKHKKKSAS